MGQQQTALGWTGGQYSLFRGALGLYLAVHFLMWIFIGPQKWHSVFVDFLLILGLVLSWLLLIGLRDRLSALGLSFLVLFFPSTIFPTMSLLLLAMAFISKAPYGSWKGRGQQDPTGEWEYPAYLYVTAWFVIALLYFYRGYIWVLHPSQLTWYTGILAGFQLLFIPLAVFKTVRPWIWLIAFILQIYLLFWGQTAVWLFALLFIFNPVWIRGRNRQEKILLFYDGTCGLCHKAVRFLISEDLYAQSYFAPLEGPLLTKLLPQTKRPDSLVVYRENQAPLFEARAVRYLLKYVGGFWCAIAWLSYLIPLSWLNGLYRFIAKYRYRWFTRPYESCPQIAPLQRIRFPTHWP